MHAASMTSICRQFDSKMEDTGNHAVSAVDGCRDWTGVEKGSLVTPGGDLEGV